MTPFAVSKRMSLGLFLAAGTLLLLIPLTRGYGLGPFWGQDEFHAPLVVYLLVPLVYAISRYGNARFAVLTLGVLLLLVCAGALTMSSLSPTKFAKTGAVAVCAVGLLLGFRWSAYVWYVLAVLLAGKFVQLVLRAIESNWMSSAATEVQTTGLITLIVGVGGSAAVATYFRNRAARPPAGLVAAHRANLTALAAGLVCAVGLAWYVGEWEVPPRFPDTPGVATLHRSLRGMAMGGSQAPSCDKISYCGKYVELSCHPEVDGLDSFYDNTNGAIVMHCGGSCMNGSGPLGSKRCEACPPPEWAACTTASAASSPR